MTLGGFGYTGSPSAPGSVHVRAGPQVATDENRRTPASPLWGEHLHPLRRSHPPPHQPRPRRQEARPAHHPRRPDPPRRTPHHLPVLRPATGHEATALLRDRPMPRKATVAPDRDVPPRGPQVRPRTRRPRGRTAAQRRPKRQDRHAPAATLPALHHRRSPTVPPPSQQRPAPRPVRTRPAHRTPQRRTPRRSLGRPRSQRRNRHHPPLPPAHPQPGPDRPEHQDPRLRTPYRPPTECISSLKIHQERQQEERQAAGKGWTDSDLVFTTPQGKPLDPTNLTRRFRRLLHSSGLRTIRFHDLRHSTATLLLEQGVDLVAIKELLGHAHIGVTACVYAHVRLRLQRQAIDTLGNALGPTGTPDDSPTAAVVR